MVFLKIVEITKHRYIETNNNGFIRISGNRVLTSTNMAAAKRLCENESVLCFFAEELLYDDNMLDDDFDEPMANELCLFIESLIKRNPGVESCIPFYYEQVVPR